nr:signal recognition particle subunit SRP68 [Ipomoea batatas]GMD25912.1 signal recognition particle subunit SRP68 [Ipomoea batatas]
MANGNGVSAMEIEEQNPNNADQINKSKFSINVLQLLKSAQMQHGLRFGDYTRYRRYCTARLRRLYKSLKFTHGRGKYTKRAITAAVVTEVRFLHLVLYTAERAWSHAMEKKTLPDGPNARQRSYLIGRLRKAVKWAILFEELCAIKGDSKTSLEAEAYAAYMKGNLLFEQDKNWDVALKCFRSARAVYEQLGKYGDLENQVLCREYVEQLEPSIRYCLHKIGESNLQTSELVHIGEMEGPALDLFKAKLEAAMAEARSQQAASMTEFTWLGHRFPISNAKTRVSILKAQELERDIHGPAGDSLPAEKRLVVFDKIFAAYHEARSSIRSDLVTAANSENVKDEFFWQNTSDLSDLVSSGRDRKPEEVAFAEECELKSMVFRAQRCFYLAKSYSSAGKRTEAYALFSRARSLADAALKKLHSVDISDQVIVNELEVLSNESRSNSCIEHARGIMEEEKVPENLSKKISDISLTGNDKKLEKFLMEKLDSYESAVGDSNTKVAPRIEVFPPPFQAVPRNPIVLDLAYNLIDFPALDSRMRKDKKGGFISRFWG